MADDNVPEQTNNERTIEDVKAQEDILNNTVNLDASLSDVEAFVIPDAPIADIDGDLEGEVEPPQSDEFICTNCFLVLNASQIDHPTKNGFMCKDCASGA